MKNNDLKKTKRFLIPILSLVIISIILIASINTYINISMFKQHMNEDIEQYKKEYLERNKNAVYKKVHLFNSSIKFQITKIENKLKKSLKERVITALHIADDIYRRHKEDFSDDEIRTKILKHLDVIKFNDRRGYYFVYDYNSKIVLVSAIKKMIGKNLAYFKDIKGNNIAKMQIEAMKQNKFAFTKIYFKKPANPNKEYPKLSCTARFKPLNLVIGTGEYLDVVEKQIKSYVIDRFSNMEKEKNRYLFVLDLHNINGGDNFATMILNPNREDLIGKKLNDSYKDAKGKEFRKEFLEGLREKGECYTEYWYKKPDMKNPKPKMSYFYLQKDWNWIIASGFYFDDLEKHISEKENEHIVYTNNAIYKALILICILSFIVIIIAILVSLRIDKTIKNYTDKLVKNRLALELAQKVAKMGSWSLDLTTNKLKWSDETYKIFEIKKGEFKSIYDAFLSKIHPEDKDIVDNAYKKSLKNKKSYTIIHRLLMRDDKIKWVEEKCETIFDKSGNPIVSNGTVQDITKEYELQQNQIMQEKLILEQSKNAQMGAMIGNIAHQWRQPLSVISTAASGILISKEFNALTDEKENEMLKGIVNSTEFLSNTIDTFRDYIKEKKEFKEVILQDRINGAINIIEASMKNGHIELINNINDIEPIKITMVVGELSQVIINIINNAKDVLVENNIDNKIIKINLIKKEHLIIITIEDNGGGISEDVLPKIFEPYFTTKHQSQGT
ncbi:MAG: cache domain-containing protein, partial [Arcobacteraceae bacterium]|nr:cache domain-containing protein [Arcobacteraceae bacterium]